MQAQITSPPAIVHSRGTESLTVRELLRLLWRKVTRR